MRRFLLGYALYLVGVSVALAWLGVERSVLDVEFLFGPAVEGVARGAGLPDAARMPLVPMFLGTVARLSDSVLLALVLKNLLLAGALGRALWDAGRDAPRRWIRIAAVGYLATFPQLVRHGLALVPEEGWLVPLLGFVFHGLLVVERRTSVRAATPFAFAAALAFLAKSSVAPLAVALPLLFAWRTRSARVFALFAGVLLFAAGAWATHNFVHTGRFSAATSMDGYNFWKGNNAHTLEHFPWRSLDAISDLAPERGADESEWTWDRRCFDEGLRFDLEHPGDAARIAFRRLYQVFLAVTPEAPARADDASAARLVGVPHMLVFRLALLVGLGAALRAIFARQRGEARERAVVFVVFVGLFALPYLLAWGVERRLMPLVVPTVLFALSVVRSRASSRSGTFACPKPF